jgi:phage repressor protein C with HTH and peptisase S24 domain
VQAIARRLHDLMLEFFKERGMDPIAADFAHICGLADSSLRNYLQAKAIPNSDKSIMIAEATGVSIDWLLTGQGPRYRRPLVGGELPSTSPEALAAADVIFIPFFDVAASAGGGAFVEEGAERSLVPLSKSWIQRSLGVSPRHLSMIRVMGDSMAPTLDSGDMVIVDESAKFADRIVEGIFVLRIDGYLRVKRLERMKERIRVLSDNPAYRPEVYRLNQLQEEFAVLGRVVAAVKPTA